MKTGTVFACALIAGIRLFGQAPRFEVESIKPSAPEDPSYHQGWSKGGPGSPDPTQWSCGNNSLANLITMAYDIDYRRLSAPTWMNSTDYDIAARIPAGATRAQFRLMMQDMLARRFGLVVHREQKQMPVFDLAVGKNGAKLKESTGDDPAAANPQTSRRRVDENGYPIPAPGQGIRFSGSNERSRMDGNGVTMAEFAKVLAGPARRQVIDKTGLTGKYDFILYWTSDTPDASGPTLEEALQQQLGLRFLSGTGLVDNIVVDKAEKIPTTN